MKLYAVIEVENPRYSGEVVFKLNAVITNRISLGTEQIVVVNGR
ncbi:hypothetical protein [Okeania sp. SIO1I7]|nr:hypothetical protein [Okeania sp. SIO1I7]